MAKLRNISDNTLEVPLISATVEPDTVVEVPDSLIWSETNPDGYAWPDTIWAVVGTSKKSAPAAEEGA